MSSANLSKSDKKAAQIRATVSQEVKKLSDKAFEEISKLQEQIAQSNSPREIEKLNKKIGVIQDKLQKSVSKFESVGESMLGSVNSKKLTTEVADKVGSLIAKKQFGLATIQFYSNGYVSVKKSLPQKLISIEASNNTTSKTLPGRAVSQLLMAPLTAGMSLATGAVAPSLRGTLSLVIVTDVTAHSLVVDTPMDAFVKSMYEIEGIGKSLIAQSNALTQASQTQHQSVGAAKSLGEQLQELSDLREKNIISEAEFLQAKSRLLA